MITSLARARAVGALLAFAAFAIGAAGGMWYAGRVRPGINLTVTATDRMPEELARLDLSDAERAPIEAALRRGRDRVLRARDDLDLRMQLAVDSTDAEIRTLLSPAHRAAFDSARRANGPALRKREVILRP